MLIDEFLLPTVSAEAYCPGQGAVRIAAANSHPIVAEVVRRENGTFGYRLFAWVAWRDAGNQVRSHSWHQVVQLAGVVASPGEAEELAAAHARSKGISLGAWRAAA